MKEKSDKPVVRMSKDELRQFAKDVAAGLSDERLNEKYGLSGRLLALHKMVVKDFLAAQSRRSSGPVMKISAEEILNDITQGMEDTAIMAKYGITPRQLQRVYRKIISAGLLSPMELAGRLSVTRSQVFEAFVEAGKEVPEKE